jgi:hypothetical protein
MIWYLHWLQMRRGLIVSMLYSIVAGVVIGLAMSRAARTAVPSSDAVVLPAMQLAIPLVAFFAAMLLAGNGLTNSRDGRGVPAYTLSLPLTRRNLMASRLIATVVLIAATLALLFGLGAAWLTIAGQAVPWTGMARLCALTLAGVIPVMMTTALIRLYFEQQWAAVGVWVLLVPMMRWLGLANNRYGGIDPSLPTGAVLAYSSVFTALLVATLFQLGERKEF